MAQETGEVSRYSEDFELLRDAVGRGDVALVECQEVATGDIVTVISIVRRQNGEESVEFLPFAQFYKENPYYEWRPPNPAGGFFPALDEEE